MVEDAVTKLTNGIIDIKELIKVIAIKDYRQTGKKTIRRV